MKKTLFGVAIVAACASLPTAPPVFANDLHDTVRARANARAGGPTNGHDAWILERYGKLSGTGSSYYGEGPYGLTSTEVTSGSKRLRKWRKRY